MDFGAVLTGISQSYQFVLIVLASIVCADSFLFLRMLTVSVCIDGTCTGPCWAKTGLGPGISILNLDPQFGYVINLPPLKKFS